MQQSQIQSTQLIPQPQTPQTQQVLSTQPIIAIIQSTEPLTLQYFPIHCLQQNITKPKCTQMISQQQLDQRGLDQFQKYPFKPIAKYFRNKSYNIPNELRTPQSLDKSLQYLKQNFLVTILNDKKKIQKIILGKSRSDIVQDKEKEHKKELKLDIILRLVQQSSFESFCVKSNNNKNQGRRVQRQQNKGKNIGVQQNRTKSILRQSRNSEYNDLILPQKILVFLQTRLQAIRCQLFAQGILFPRLTLELLKCELFLYTMKLQQYSNIGGDINSYQQLKLVGLDIILDENNKQLMTSRQDFQQYYIDALIIAIFRTKTKDLTRLIQDHQRILLDDKLLNLFRLRLNIQKGNYHKYFTYLRQSQDAFIISLLLTHLPKIRQRLCHVLKSAKIDVKKSWLAFLLGLTITKQEQNQIININKNTNYINNKIQNRQVQSRQKQLKNWLKLQDLFDKLIINNKQLNTIQKNNYQQLIKNN